MEQHARGVQPIMDPSEVALSTNWKEPVVIWQVNPSSRKKLVRRAVLALLMAGIAFLAIWGVSTLRNRRMLEDYKQELQAALKAHATWDIAAGKPSPSMAVSPLTAFPPDSPRPFVLA